MQYARSCAALKLSRGPIQKTAPWNVEQELTGEMTQQLRALTAPAENPGSNSNSI